jgi:hypothetical protein
MKELVQTVAHGRLDLKDPPNCRWRDSVRRVGCGVLELKHPPTAIGGIYEQFALGTFCQRQNVFLPALFEFVHVDHTQDLL